jgi:predicted secreted acid phosphatase
MSIRRISAGLVLVAALASWSSAWAAKCPDVPSGIVLDQSPVLNVGQIKLLALEYKCFGRYDADFAQIIGEAKSYIELRSAQVEKPALVLDIDETSLTNWPQIVANDFGYIPKGKCDALPDGPCGIQDWELNHTADAIGPTLALFKFAKAKGVAIFFITGRPASNEEIAATSDNLRKAGYEGWTDLYLRKSGYLSVAEYKIAMRAKITSDGYTIIANIGDQHSDLVGGYAERTFKVPNPFYYIP